MSWVMNGITSSNTTDRKRSRIFSFSLAVCLFSLSSSLITEQTKLANKWDVEISHKTVHLFDNDRLGHSEEEEEEDEDILGQFRGSTSSWTTTTTTTGRRDFKLDGWLISAVSISVEQKLGYESANCSSVAFSLIMSGKKISRHFCYTNRIEAMRLHKFSLR